MLPSNLAYEENSTTVSYGMNVESYLCTVILHANTVKNVSYGLALGYLAYEKSQLTGKDYFYCRKL